MVHISFFIEFPGIASPHRRLAPAVAVDKKLWPTRRRCSLFLKLISSFPECFQKFIAGLCSTPNDGPDVSKAVQLTQYVKWVFARVFLVIGQDFLNSKASFELAMKFGAHIPIKWWRTKQRKQTQESNSWKSEPFLLNSWGFKKSQTAKLELAIFISRMGIARCIKSWPYLHDHGLDYWPNKPHKWIRIWIMSICIPNSYSLDFSSIFLFLRNEPNQIISQIESTVFTTSKPCRTSIGSWIMAASAPWASTRLVAKRATTNAAVSWRFVAFRRFSSFSRRFVGNFPHVLGSSRVETCNLIQGKLWELSEKLVA